MRETATVVIGAGPAGLAVGACLRLAGIEFVLLERAPQSGSAWRSHYDRLRLHTPKQHSALPYLPFPKEYPTYPSREQFVRYLEGYERHFGLAPRYGQHVVQAEHRDGAWETRTTDATYRSANLVIATGNARVPHRPAWPGEDGFQGKVLHSSVYRNGEPFRGQNVLVVGFGNSGGEIALDLLEHGARPELAVRGPVNIVPRDILGIPLVTVSLGMRFLPAGVADALAAPIQRLRTGDLTRYGLRRQPFGPNAQVRRTGRIPLIDVGTVGAIKAGQVRVRPGLEQFTPQGVTFADGTAGSYQAVILATGYRPAVKEFLHGADEALTPEGAPLVSGRPAALPGLYFCGFNVTQTGMLREIGLEARQIAREISRAPVAAPPAKEG